MEEGRSRAGGGRAQHPVNSSALRMARSVPAATLAVNVASGPASCGFTSASIVLSSMFDLLGPGLALLAPILATLRSALVKTADDLRELANASRLTL